MPDDPRTGFTGTRHGLTPPQRNALLSEIGVLHGWLHHGDCVGADAYAHALAVSFGLLVQIHPPIAPELRAWCRDADVVLEPAPHLVRNRAIVDATKLLIATPVSEEVLRSGTWSTVRYARRIGRPVVLVMPDGSVRREDGQ